MELAQRIRASSVASQELKIEGYGNVEAETERWFVILTEPQREVTAAAGLVSRRFEAFGPSVYSKQVVKRQGREMKDEHGRKIYRKVERPMFPGYIFAKFARGAERFEDARKVSGVREFLKIEGVPATLPTVLIDAIRREEEKQLSVYEESIKPVGALVIPFVQGGPAKIEDGPYDGWVGQMVKLKKNGRITMLLSQFGRDVPVEIDAGQIRAA